MTPFVKCWGAGGVPQDTRDARIVTLYKNKGDRSNCNSYRGISLLSIVGKLYARVLLVHPQQLAECVYPEFEGSMSRPFDIKWREARLRPCSNPLRSPLLPPFEIYVN